MSYAHDEFLAGLHTIRPWQLMDIMYNHRMDGDIISATLPNGFALEFNMCEETYYLVDTSDGDTRQIAEGVALSIMWQYRFTQYSALNMTPRQVDYLRTILDDDHYQEFLALK